MIVNLETLRAVVRPYASHVIGLSELLEKLWPILLDADEDSRELVASIEDLLALHAARLIDDVALRQRLVGIAFAPGTLASVTVSEVHSGSQSELSGGILRPTPTFSDG